MKDPQKSPFLRTMKLPLSSKLKVDKAPKTISWSQFHTFGIFSSSNLFPARWWSSSTSPPEQWKFMPKMQKQAIFCKWFTNKRSSKLCDRPSYFIGSKMEKWRDLPREGKLVVPPWSMPPFLVCGILVPGALCDEYTRAGADMCLLKKLGLSVTSTTGLPPSSRAPCSTLFSSHLNWTNFYSIHFILVWMNILNKNTTTLFKHHQAFLHAPTFCITHVPFDST